MNFFQRVLRNFNIDLKRRGYFRAAVSDSTDNRIPTSGRVSTDTGMRVNFNAFAILPPEDHLGLWQLRNLDITTLDNYTPQELLDFLIDISPEISKAVWDLQRLFNPGYECKVYELGPDKRISERGQAHINAFINRLKSNYGSFDVVIGRVFMGGYMRGGFCAELVLDKDGRQSIDLATPDPYSIRFRKIKDPVRGEVWQPGQWQNTEFVPLDIPTFRYVPIDPAPASPYGRSVAAPSLFTAVFILSLLHDIKRVIMQQGYKRLDISLDTEQAMDNFAFDNQGYKNLSSYIRGAISSIRDTYADLAPDDALIHTDMFNVELPVGTVSSDSIGAIDTIMQRLEKSVTRALKSNSLIMDTDSSMNETDSNRRWEILVAGVKSLQHLCEGMFETLFAQSLQAEGIQARAEFRFAELRAAEMFRDEQTKALQVQNARNMYEAGFVSQDEASNYAINHDADQPEPRKPLVDLDFQEDNNSGNEALNQGSDERYILVPASGGIPYEYRLEKETTKNGFHKAT